MSVFQDQSLGNWRIKRQVLDGEDIAYKFTPKYVLRAGQTVTVGARECWAGGRCCEGSAVLRPAQGPLSCECSGVPAAQVMSCV